MQETSHPAHPTPRFYVTVFGWLTVLTIIEVSVAAVLPLIGFPDAVRIAVLVAMAIIKALLVVLYYMHLRYDSRWYTVILLVGLFFALLVGRLLMAMAQ